MRVDETSWEKGDASPVALIVQAFGLDDRRAGDFTESLPGEIALTSDGGAILRIGWDTDGDGLDDVVVRGERVGR